MLAGVIFDKMSKDGKTTPQEWRDNKVLHEKFYEELARAEKMPIEKAFKQYIPNTPVNRKRMVGMGMEEKGIENTTENFKALYGQMREKGIFDKMLAKQEEARTTISSRLLVETARIKHTRQEYSLRLKFKHFLRKSGGAFFTTKLCTRPIIDTRI